MAKPGEPKWEKWEPIAKEIRRWFEEADWQTAERIENALCVGSSFFLCEFQFQILSGWGAMPREEWDVLLTWLKNQTKTPIVFFMKECRDVRTLLICDPAEKKKFTLIIERLVPDVHEDEDEDLPANNDWHW